MKIKLTVGIQDKTDLDAQTCNQNNSDQFRFKTGKCLHFYLNRIGMSMAAEWLEG